MKMYPRAYYLTHEKHLHAIYYRDVVRRVERVHVKVELHAIIHAQSSILFRCHCQSLKKYRAVFIRMQVYHPNELKKVL